MHSSTFVQPLTGYLARLRPDHQDLALAGHHNLFAEISMMTMAQQDFLNEVDHVMKALNLFDHGDK